MTFGKLLLAKVRAFTIFLSARQPRAAIVKFSAISGAALLIYEGFGKAFRPITESDNGVLSADTTKKIDGEVPSDNEDASSPTTGVLLQQKPTTPSGSKSVTRDGTPKHVDRVPRGQNGSSQDGNQHRKPR